MMKCICYFALFIKVQNCTKYLRTFSAPYSSSYRCARLILNFTNGMTLECANHPFPCSNFHLNQTLPDRNHWSFRIFTEAVILHPTFLEYIMVFFFAREYHCPCSCSFTAKGRSLCLCLFSGVTAVVYT